ncbi:MAG: hypothetical protein IAE89_11730 [Anaerolineae bacterium]|nr:hypothetical protein [Anaerolineae bacterium]
MPSRQFMIAASCTFIFCAILCALVLITRKGDPVAFAVTGTLFTNRTAEVPDPNLTVGYDGQFAYYIARDGAASLPLLDGPSFRLQRILYPLAGRLLAFGQPALVPWSLLLINLVAQSIGAGLMAVLLSTFPRTPAILGGITYGLWVGLIFALRLSLTEILCFTLAIGAILSYQKMHFRTTVILLMLSTITKELGLVIAAGLALHAFAQKRRGWSVLIFGAPFILLMVWWGILRLMFGDVPTQYPAARFEFIPLRGIFVGRIDTVELIMLGLWIVIPTLILFTLAIITLWRKRILSVSTSLVLAASAFIFVMPGVSWEDPLAAYRVATPIIIAGLIFLAEHFPKQLKWFCILWISALALAAFLPALWV